MLFYSHAEGSELWLQHASLPTCSSSVSYFTHIQCRGTQRSTGDLSEFNEDSGIIGTFNTIQLWQIMCALVIVVATSQQSSGALGLEATINSLRSLNSFQKDCQHSLMPQTPLHIAPLRLHAHISKSVTTRWRFYSVHTYVELSAWGWTRPVYQHSSPRRMLHLSGNLHSQPIYTLRNVVRW